MVKEEKPKSTRRRKKRSVQGFKANGDSDPDFRAVVNKKSTVHNVDARVTRRRTGVSKVKSSPEQEWMRGKRQWRTKEKLRLISAVEEHGFTELTKLSKVVKTKNTAETATFIDQITRKIRKSISSVQDFLDLAKLVSSGRKNSYSMDDLKRYPPVALWQRLLQNYTTKGPMHVEVLANLFQQLSKPAPAVNNAEVHNLRYNRGYKHVSDLLRGSNMGICTFPEAMMILCLQQELHLFVEQNDLSTERNFLDEFTGPPSFTKEELKNATNDKEENGVDPKHEPVSDGEGSKVIHRVSEEVMKHIEMKDINPMVIPLEMLSKEQQLIAQDTQKRLNQELIAEQSATALM